MRKALIGLSLLIALSWGQTAFAFEPAPGTVTVLNLTSDCLPCALQNKVVANVAAFYGDTIAVRALDVDADPSLKTTFHLDILPTLILYDRKGQEVSRHGGFLRETALKERIQSALEAK